jgi:hypothetical protein
MFITHLKPLQPKTAITDDLVAFDNYELRLQFSPVVSQEVICSYACTHVLMYVYVCVYKQACVSVQICVHAYVCALHMHKHAYVYMLSMQVTSMVCVSLKTYASGQEVPPVNHGITIMSLLEYA